jgi:hypothetical protein
MVLGLVALVAACDASGTADVGTIDRADASVDAPGPDAPGLDAPGLDAPASRDDAPSTGLLRDRHPGDEGLADDPAVLFFDDFESGWGRWDAPSADTAHLFVETSDVAHAGARQLRATVTHDQLRDDMYIGAAPRVLLSRPVPDLYVRLHARFVGIAPNPHHWIRFAAGDAGFSSSGLANTVPPGDQGFWFDWDASLENTFSFYAYWFRMRSGRCNDGTAVPGCAGDQGTTYYYGNTFVPPDQAEGGFERDQWICLELGMHVNTVGESDGALEAWIDDVPVGRFGPGEPVGTWLRDQLPPWRLLVQRLHRARALRGLRVPQRGRRALQGALPRRLLPARHLGEDSRDELVIARAHTVSESSTILYDDVVAATERIGCRR